MSILEQSGDLFDFCVLFRVHFTGKGTLGVCTDTIRNWLKASGIQPKETERQNRLERRQRDLEAENRALRKQLAQKDEVIEILKKSVGILSRP